MWPLIILTNFCVISRPLGGKNFNFFSKQLSPVYGNCRIIINLFRINLKKYLLEASLNFQLQILNLLKQFQQLFYPHMKDRGILKIFVMILKNILQVLILLAGSCILVSGEQGVLTPCLQQYVDCILRTPAANNLHCSKHPSAEKFNFETRKF